MSDTTPAHDHSHDFRSAGRRTLLTVLVIIGAYMAIEVVAGILSGSLGLLAHAAHMVTDFAAISLALFGMWVAQRPATVTRTFGYQRVEVLVVIVNVAALVGLATWIYFEAFHRFGRHFTGDGHEVEGWTILLVAAFGLAVNSFSAWILYRSSKHSINLEGAFWHILADLMGSFAVLVSGILLLIFGWHVIDAILSIIIASLILVTSGRLAVKVFHILVEGVPAGLDLFLLCSTLEDIEGVTFVHDIHAWTITTGYNALEAHVLIDPDFQGDTEQVALQLRRIIRNQFGIHHITLQLERSDAHCEESHHLGRLETEVRGDSHSLESSASS